MYSNHSQQLSLTRDFTKDLNIDFFSHDFESRRAWEEVLPHLLLRLQYFSVVDNPKFERLSLVFTCAMKMRKVIWKEALIQNFTQLLNSNQLKSLNCPDCFPPSTQELLAQWAHCEVPPVLPHSQGGSFLATTCPDEVTFNSVLTLKVLSQYPVCLEPESFLLLWV